MKLTNVSTLADTHEWKMGRRESGLKVVALMASFIGSASGQASDKKRDAPVLTVPFVFASGRGSLIVKARINDRAALLIVDTGSSHTMLQPSVAGINPSALARPRTGAGVIGDAVGQEVTLEIGERVWQRRRVP